MNGLESALKGAVTVLGIYMCIGIWKYVIKPYYYYLRCKNISKIWSGVIVYLTLIILVEMFKLIL